MKKLRGVNFDHKFKKGYPGILSVFILIASWGCSHTFAISKFNKQTWKPEGQEIEGILYYDPQFVKVTYSFSVLVDEEGNVVRPGAANTCVRVVQKEEIQVRPDFTSPRVLKNKPSWFSTGKLGATLTDGMLTSINSESNPTLPQLLSAIASVATAVKPSFVDVPSPTGKTPACNSSPIITAYDPIEIKRK